MESRNPPSNESAQTLPMEGKGKAPASLPSRIVSSASGLVSDVVGSTASSDFAKTVSNGTSGKIPNGSSSTSQSHWSQSLPATSTPNGSGPGQSAALSGNFRSESNQYIHEMEFQDFMDEGNLATSNGLAGGYRNDAPWLGEFQQHHIAEENPSIPPGNTIQHDDGAEVRMLLSDPQFGADPDAMDVTMGDSMDDTVQDLFGGEYSAGERRAADKIKSSLPPPPVHKGVSADNALNLMPDFGSQHQQTSNASQNMEQEDDDSVYLANTPAREQWVSEWDSVLNSYTDEVWGDMLGSVKEARSELEEVKAGSRHVGNQAVSRLKMILGHVVQNAEPALTHQQASSFSQSSAESTHLKNMERHFLAYQMDSLHITQQRVQQGINGTMTGTTVHANQSQHHHDQMMSGQNKYPIHEAHQHEVRRDSPMTDREDEPQTPTFHCPWVSCHRRFNNATEFRLHTSAHTQYACPHEDCFAQFTSHEEWADHIIGPHHGLLETNFRSPRVAETQA